MAWIGAEPLTDLGWTVPLSYRATRGTYLIHKKMETKRFLGKWELG